MAASRLYTGFVRADVLPAGTDPATLDALLAAGWRHGLHATLFAPYEFGGALVGAPVHCGDAPPFHDGALQLPWFRNMARLDGDAVAAWLATRAESAPAGAMDVRAEPPQAAYADAIARIHAYIEAGDTHQVNFTQRLRFRLRRPGDVLRRAAGRTAGAVRRAGLAARRWLGAVAVARAVRRA